jgi:hypothetical protein
VLVGSWSAVSRVVGSLCGGRIMVSGGVSCGLESWVSDLCVGGSEVVGFKKDRAVVGVVVGSGWD